MVTYGALGCEEHVCVQRWDGIVRGLSRHIDAVVLVKGAHILIKHLHLERLAVRGPYRRWGV